jgi:hypothetical protein
LEPGYDWLKGKKGIRMKQTRRPRGKFNETGYFPANAVLDQRLEKNRSIHKNRKRLKVKTQIKVKHRREKETKEKCMRMASNWQQPRIANHSIQPVGLSLTLDIKVGAIRFLFGAGADSPSDSRETAFSHGSSFSDSLIPPKSLLPRTLPLTELAALCEIADIGV